MKKKGKKRVSTAGIIARASLKCAPWLLISAGIGFGLYHIDEIRYFNHDDISRFLNSDKRIEQQDDSYVEEETNNETQEAEEEVSNEEVENALPYPDIIPEIDYERVSSEIYDMDIELPSVDWEYVNDVNEEANAWLYLPGVGVGDGLSLPVVQGTDNEYYLTHDIEGKEDDRGTLFIDWRNNPMDNGMQELSDVTCIFGHHRKSGSMFGSLSNYKTQTFYDRHPYGVIIAENGDVYKIDFFAGVVVDGADELNVYAADFIDESQFNAYFDNIVSNSTFVSDCKVQYGDKIIVLQTCSYEYGGAKFLLYGILTKQNIKEQENVQEVQGALGI